MNEKALSLIKYFEGCNLTSYKCPAGVWTIGFGHTKDVTPNMRITLEEAEKFLIDDLNEVLNQVNKVINVNLNDDQMAALLSFTFNLGIGNLKKSTLLKLINKGNFEEASKEFVKWNKANGKVLPGLTIRRLEEKKLFNGEYK